MCIRDRSFPTFWADHRPSLAQLGESRPLPGLDALEVLQPQPCQLRSYVAAACHERADDERIDKPEWRPVHRALGYAVQDFGHLYYRRLHDVRVACQPRRQG